MAQSLHRLARVLGQSSASEPPAARDQSLETWIRDELIGRTISPRGGGLRVGGLDFLIAHDMRFIAWENEVANDGAPAGVRRWVGRRVCLSCDSCLL